MGFGVSGFQASVSEEGWALRGGELFFLGMRLRLCGFFETAQKLDPGGTWESRGCPFFGLKGVITERKP